MTSILPFIIITSAIFILVVGFIISIALATILGKRPIILSARWMFGMMCPLSIPIIIYSFSKGFDVKQNIHFILYVIFLVALWIKMRGYMILGVSDAYFRDAIQDAARTLGLTIEETGSRLRIIETGEEIKVTISGFSGWAQLKPVKAESRNTVSRIVEGMKTYFETTKGKMSYFISYVWIIGAFSAIVIPVASFVLMAMLISEPQGNLADIKKAISTKPDHAILLCTIETKEETRVLKVATCLRPFANNEEIDWNTNISSAHIQLDKYTERCQGAIVYIDPKDRDKHSMSFIYDGKVGLPDLKDYKTVTLTDFISVASKKRE